MKKAFVCVVVVVLLSSANLSAAPRFTVTDLGTLGGSISAGSEINNNGVVVGTSQTISGENHAFLYDGTSMLDLGTLDRWSLATGLNSSGDSVGSYLKSVGSSSYLRAFIHDGVIMTDLGTLGSNYSEAAGINDSGQVVGTSASNTSGARAFLYDGLSMIDLGTLGGVSSQGHAINNSGHVVGTSWTSTGLSRAFLHDGTTMLDLGSLSGDDGWSGARGINNNGHIVGHSSNSVNDLLHAFIHDGTTMIDLGTLIGDEYYSVAYGINDSGQVVGEFRPASLSSLSAFYYDGSEMYDLNTLIDPSLGWTFKDARGINDSGQITGFGLINGEQRAYLLTPTTVPVPSALVLGIIGLGTVRLRFRKRRD